MSTECGLRLWPPPPRRPSRGWKRGRPTTAPGPGASGEFPNLEPTGAQCALRVGTGREQGAPAHGDCVHGLITGGVGNAGHRVFVALLLARGRHCWCGHVGAGLYQVQERAKAKNNENRSRTNPNRNVMRPLFRNWSSTHCFRGSTHPRSRLRNIIRRPSTKHTLAEKCKPSTIQADSWFQLQNISVSILACLTHYSVRNAQRYTPKNGQAPRPHTNASAADSASPVPGLVQSLVHRSTSGPSTAVTALVCAPICPVPRNVEFPVDVPHVCYEHNEDEGRTDGRSLKAESHLGGTQTHNSIQRGRCRGRLGLVMVSQFRLSPGFQLRFLRVDSRPVRGRGAPAGSVGPDRGRGRRT